ncbi:hypothetical protein [Streptomyces sp. NBC_01236]|uniref:hypothetical protein n=1 Tax=Streptomyces sp. NBC_01236 TaxID=2903789 RepID=UPI002E0FEEEF|nr:hypothetical protein OG324_17535 [Streptomyces sp. NBC_01236]
MLTPVTDLLNAALKAGNGQLSADDAAKLSQAVKDAIAKVTAAAPVTPPVALPTTPTTTAPTAPTAPTTPTTTTEPTTPALAKSAERQDDGKAPSAKGSRAEAPEDLKGDALAALQTAVYTLAKAVSSGDATQVVPAAPW